MITEEEFGKWLESLSKHDKMNFEVLIGLPKAQELVDKMPEGRYKDMTNFVLSRARQALGLDDA